MRSEWIGWFAREKRSTGQERARRQRKRGGVGARLGLLVKGKWMGLSLSLLSSFFFPFFAVSFIYSFFLLVLNIR